MLAVLLTIAHAVALRRWGTAPGPSARWAAIGAVCYLLAFAVWLAAVAPANSAAAAAQAMGPSAFTQAWIVLRTRWEFGHAVGFLFQLAGLGALVWSAVRETGLESCTR